MEQPIPPIPSMPDAMQIKERTMLKLAIAGISTILNIATQPRPRLRQFRVPVRPSRQARSNRADQSSDRGWGCGSERA